MFCWSGSILCNKYVMKACVIYKTNINYLSLFHLCLSCVSWRIVLYWLLLFRSFVPGSCLPVPFSNAGTGTRYLFLFLFFWKRVKPNLHFLHRRTALFSQSDCAISSNPFLSECLFNYTWLTGESCFCNALFFSQSMTKQTFPLKSSNLMSASAIISLAFKH